VVLHSIIKPPSPVIRPHFFLFLDPPHFPFLRIQIGSLELTIKSCCKTGGWDVALSNLNCHRCTLSKLTTIVPNSQQPIPIPSFFQRATDGLVWRQVELNGYVYIWACCLRRRQGERDSPQWNDGSGRPVCPDVRYVGWDWGWGRDDRRRTAPPWAVVMGVASTAEYTATVMLHYAQRVDPWGLTRLAHGCWTDEDDTWMVLFAHWSCWGSATSPKHNYAANNNAKIMFFCYTTAIQTPAHWPPFAQHSSHRYLDRRLPASPQPTHPRPITSLCRCITPHTSGWSGPGHSSFSSSYGILDIGSVQDAVMKEG